jgi:hypothetical protein
LRESSAKSSPIENCVNGWGVFGAVESHQSSFDDDGKSSSDAWRPRWFQRPGGVERAIICAWRRRRVYRIETGMPSKVRKFWAPALHEQRTVRNAVTRAAVGRIIASDDD